jgi:DNA-binding NarL/FixJ family response regulator
MNMKTSLLIAESSELFQLGVTKMLEKLDEIELLGFANSNDDLLHKVKQLNPDVVLIDYMAKNFSVEVIKLVKAKHPGIKWLGITGERVGNIVTKGIKNGIKSYVKKDCSRDEIIEAIVETGKGKKFFCGELLEQMRNENVDIENIETDLSCDPVYLSDRELEIIKLIAEGYTNAQISVVLYISNHTVNTHRKNIMKKLGVNNTAAIVLFAVKTGLVVPDQFMALPDGNDTVVRS